MVEQILAGDEPRGATDAETAVAALRPGEELVALFYDGDSGELAGLYRLPSLEDHRWSR
jgi:hypothetical protein